MPKGQTTMLSIHPVVFTSSLLAHLAIAFAPVGGAVAAIIALTLLVRLAVHPLTRAAVRGERSRLRLAPRVTEIRRRYAGNLPQLRTELTALYKRENLSPFAGFLPLLVQAPIFLVLYAAFRDSHGPLAGAHLFGVPLATHAFAAAGIAHFATYGVLFVALAALAWLSSRRAARLMTANTAMTSNATVASSRAVAPSRTSGSRRTLTADRTATSSRSAVDTASVEATVTKLGRIMPYALLISAVVLPLAAVIYLVTTTAWSTIENAALRRGLL